MDSMRYQATPFSAAKEPGAEEESAAYLRRDSSVCRAARTEAVDNLCTKAPVTTVAKRETACPARRVPEIINIVFDLVLIELEPTDMLGNHFDLDLVIYARAARLVALFDAPHLIPVPTEQLIDETEAAPMLAKQKRRLATVRVLHEIIFLRDLEALPLICLCANDGELASLGRDLQWLDLAAAIHEDRLS